MYFIGNSIEIISQSLLKNGQPIRVIPQRAERFRKGVGMPGNRVTVRQLPYQDKQQAPLVQVTFNRKRLNMAIFVF